MARKSANAKNFGSVEGGRSELRIKSDGPFNNSPARSNRLN
jgi:hypothetical protein